MNSNLVFDLISTLETSAIDSRRDERAINEIVRSALKETYSLMYDAPMKVRPFHRYYKLWISRTAFYNLLENRGGSSPTRCLGMLCSDRELRTALALPPYKLSEEQECLLHRLIQLHLASANLMGWLLGIRSLDTSTALLQVSGQTNKEPNSLELLPSALESVNAT